MWNKQIISFQMLRTPQKCLKMMKLQKRGSYFSWKELCCCPSITESEIPKWPLRFCSRHQKQQQQMIKISRVIIQINWIRLHFLNSTDFYWRWKYGLIFEEEFSFHNAAEIPTLFQIYRLRPAVNWKTSAFL